MRIGSNRLTACGQAVVHYNSTRPREVRLWPERQGASYDYLYSHDASRYDTPGAIEYWGETSHAGCAPVSIQCSIEPLESFDACAINALPESDRASTFHKERSNIRPVRRYRLVLYAPDSKRQAGCVSGSVQHLIH